MTSVKDNEKLDKLVKYKVTRRVAQKVMRDIRQQVEEIKLEQSGQKKAWWFIGPLILVLVLLLLILVLYPFVFKAVSHILN
jgi:hypothetical protein